MFSTEAKPVFRLQKQPCSLEDLLCSSGRSAAGLLAGPVHHAGESKDLEEVSLIYCFDCGSEGKCRFWLVFSEPLPIAMQPLGLRRSGFGVLVTAEALQTAFGRG